MRREEERELPWGRRRGGDRLAVHPQTYSIGQSCLPVASSSKNQSHPNFIWTPKKVTSTNTRRLIYSLKKQPLGYPRLVSLLSLGLKYKPVCSEKENSQFHTYMSLPGLGLTESSAGRQHSIISLKPAFPIFLASCKNRSLFQGTQVLIHSTATHYTRIWWLI